MVQAMQRASLPNHSVILVLLYGPSDCTPEGQVAQLVEHRTENAGVAGSIPALATNLRSPCQSPMSYPVGKPLRFVVHLQEPLGR